MRRREFIAGIGSLVPFVTAARAQSKRYRVGMLDTVARGLNPNFRALQTALAERGYVEGENLDVEYRSPEGRNEGFPELARELARLDVGVIVTRGTPAALAAKAASATIPVVMAAAGDPQGIIRLAPASRNLTGFGANLPGAERMRVEILSEMLPKVARVAALMNLSNPSRRSEWNEIEAAARSLAIEPQVLDVRMVAASRPRRCWSEATRSCRPIKASSSGLRRPIGCQPSTRSGTSWRRGAWRPAASACRISTGAPPSTSTRS
jgi:putative ABC transport system substrate-binding protein